MLGRNCPTNLEQLGPPSGYGLASDLVHFRYTAGATDT